MPPKRNEFVHLDTYDKPILTRVSRPRCTGLDPLWELYVCIMHVPKVFVHTHGTVWRCGPARHHGIVVHTHGRVWRCGEQFFIHNGVCLRVLAPGWKLQR